MTGNENWDAGNQQSRHTDLSVHVELLDEGLEHVNENLAVLPCALQVSSNKQHQLGEEGEREGRRWREDTSIRNTGWRKCL